MHLRRSAALLLVAITASCVDRLPVAPDPASVQGFNSNLRAPDVRFSEIHYDNVGTDVGERIEVSGPANTNFANYSIILYNGNGGASYDTRVLTDSILSTCDGRRVAVAAYATDGIQNGSPDGMALVGPDGQVIEFLSYEGPFTATNGPANGLLSVDIGVAEGTATPVGQSLQRNSDGTWTGPVASTFGACNDNSSTPARVIASVVVSPLNPTAPEGATQTFTAAAFDATGAPIPDVIFSWSSKITSIATINAKSGVATGVAAGTSTISATAPNGLSGTSELTVTASGGPVVTPLPDTRFSEIHYDNAGTDVGEAIEIEGPVGTNIMGWTVVLYDGNGGVTYNTPLMFTGTIGTSCSTGTRGVAVLNYPSNGIQNGSPDGMALVDAQNHVIEFLSYEGKFTATNGPAIGMTSTDIVVSEPGTGDIGTSLSRAANGTWLPPTPATFGTCNGDAAPVTPPAGSGSISFSGRSATSDPPLPVGFQAQLFTTVTDENNVTITPTITWSTATPNLASVDQRGVITALAAGTAIFVATTPTGLTATYSLPFVVGTTGNASYIGNAAFGEPTDSDPSDDFILRRAEFTASYSYVRNTPNWVAYEIDPTDFGGQDRCNCFTFDPALPATFTRYTTADYTGAGAFAGYGIDRGHLARSFDRTSGNLDNAHVFYFSNIVPQAADLNQGPWANMENDLGDLVRVGGKEVYVITGVAGSLGTLKGEGLITIPAYTWKVAVVMPHDKGLADVHHGTDLEVIAAVMPNKAGIRDVDWNQYRVTVDSVQKLSGYDLLALLPDDIETQIEAGNHYPVPNALGTYSANAGATISFSGSATDVDAGDVLTYSWNFGDGGTATGAQALHVYQNGGTYSVTLKVSDQKGATTSVSTTATIVSPAPAVVVTPALVWQAAVSSSIVINFSDPNPNHSPFVVRVNWGDGTPIGTTVAAIVPLSPFSRPHVYASAGLYTVTVTVTDRDGGVGTQTFLVSVN